MFQIFNTLVRSSPESRGTVLDYFTRVISLNVRRAGMQVSTLESICCPLVFDEDRQVEPETVASDSFMVNLQAILFRFCEPFIDANYTKASVLRPDTTECAHNPADRPY